MNKNVYWIAAIIVVGLLSFYSGASIKENGATKEGVAKNMDKGTSDLQKAVDFTIETIDGETVSLKNNLNQKKSTVLYFMSSTCSTCAKNWAALNKVYPEYEDKIDFVAVSVDPTDTVEVLNELKEDKEIIFDMSAGNPELAIKYDVKKQTAKFAIDSDGNIVSRHDGALTEEEWKYFFEQL